MEVRATWLNELGGADIGGTIYDIEIVPLDDQKDPKRAIAGMEKMAQEGIHYVVGPNVDDGAAAVRPVAEQQGIMYSPPMPSGNRCMLRRRRTPFWGWWRTISPARRSTNT